MVLQSTYWLALSYFTYFFCYGIFLPFWSGWLKGEGLSAENIGLLLGAGLVARCIGSLFITPCVKIPLILLMRYVFWRCCHCSLRWVSGWEMPGYGCCW